MSIKKRQAKKKAKIKNYETNAEFWQDALEKLDLLLQRAAIHFQQQSLAANEIGDLKNNVYSSINTLLLSKKSASIHDQRSYNQLEAQIQIKTKLMSERLEITRQENTMNPMLVLQQLFNLSLFEIDILIVFIAPALDARYYKCYAYLQADASKIHPTLDLLFLLLAPTLEQQLTVKEYLVQHESALMSWQLLHTGEEFPFSFDIDSRIPLKLDLDVMKLLLFHVVPLDNNLTAIQITSPLIISAVIKTKIQSLIDYLGNSDSTQKSMHVLYFYGDDLKALENIGAMIFHKLGKKVYLLDAKFITQYLETSNLEKTCQYLTILLKQLLLNSIYTVVISNSDALFTENITLIQSTKYLFNKLQEKFQHVVLVSKDTLGYDNFNDQYNLELYAHQLFLPPTDYKQRLQTWQQAVKAHHIKITTTELENIANLFHLSVSQINNVMHVVVKESFNNHSAITADTILNQAKSQFKGKFRQLAQLLSSKYTFADIVLPSKMLAKLKRIIIFKKYHQKIYHQWAFDSKTAAKEAIIALFHGVSGTGKTMSAQAIANELHLELYRVDLASLVSKYIGETEKNLREIFNTAAMLDIVLFFDEADALFSKRTSIKDAHDRYANIETSYLLQCIEAYRGVVILASNLLENIDEAFLRRFHFIIEFPFPDFQQRKELWQKVFPPKVAIENIDYDFLADKLKITGGNIHNIALHAAFIAASENVAINMKHICQAAYEEYNKIGKLFVEADFRQYQ